MQGRAAGSGLPRSRQHYGLLRVRSHGRNSITAVTPMHADSFKVAVTYVHSLRAPHSTRDRMRPQAAEGAYHAIVGKSFACEPLGESKQRAAGSCQQRRPSHRWHALQIHICRLAQAHSHRALAAVFADERRMLPAYLYGCLTCRAMQYDSMRMDLTGARTCVYQKAPCHCCLSPTCKCLTPLATHLRAGAVSHETHQFIHVLVDNTHVICWKSKDSAP
jgi:hypothetical protein